ncbi:MAG TPA: VOC family protein [Vicinamibacterales bacterium]|nr:VOC family protein [Vicinamibacterales bacterium]
MIHSTLSRRQLLQAIGAATVGAPLSAFAQGRCMLTFGSPACNTSDITPVFEPTGWKTTSFEHLTFRVADYQKEAAFYIALMGWTLRGDDGKQAVLDLGNWGSVIFRQAPAESFESAARSNPEESRGRSSQGRAGQGTQVRAVVESFCFGIEPWNAKSVDAELRKRGLAPVADNDADGFESFRVKDPDGFNLQISNGNFAKRRRMNPPAAKLSEPVPFQPTGWKTTWLDHLSFGASDYKKSTSFYCNLLGWKGTYDEGSQNECLIGEIGDIIIRGGNPLDPNFGKGGGRSRLGIDHISFGIQPWDTDGVKAELEKRGLRAQVDTSSRHKGPDGTWVPDDIHTAAFKSYHTATPNGYNLQISYVTHDNRLALPNAVKPKPSA